MALIDCIVKCKVHSVLWQLEEGGVNLKIYLGKSENLLHRRSFRITYERPNDIRDTDPLDN